MRVSVASCPSLVPTPRRTTEIIAPLGPLGAQRTGNRKVKTMILIITGKLDGHVEAVVSYLDLAGTPWVRINVEDFPQNVEIEVDPTLGSGTLFLKDSKRLVDLHEVDAVWYRKPENLDLAHFEVADQAALDYIEAEFNEVLFGLYGLLGEAYWINNPLYTRVAHRKLLQLKVARSVGFRTPATLLTNKARPVEAFSQSVQSDLAIKSLGAISVMTEQGSEVVQYGIFTRKVSIEEVRRHADKIQHMPTIFQEFIPKDAEVRVTCVGPRHFACKIEPRPGDETADDYRFDTTNLPHLAVDCPDLAERMQKYMSSFGLNFGCFDFIVPASGGEPIFLEMNPNGQWLWVQNKVGLPIARAIADDLIQGSTLSKRRKEKAAV
jgi:glutathione synthase/RimK-type ligase-like ATP-grasp enzyme